MLPGSQLALPLGLYRMPPWFFELLGDIDRALIHRNKVGRAHICLDPQAGDGISDIPCRLVLKEDLRLKMVPFI